MKPVNNNQKITDRVLFQTLATSVLGILLCLAGLAGTTWAWFTAEIRTGPNTIQCANYSIQLTVVSQNAEGVSLLSEPSEQSESPLGPGSYTVTLTLETNAPEETGGYCTLTVSLDETSNHLLYAQLTKGEPISFSLNVVENATPRLSASAGWSRPESMNEGNTLSGGCSLAVNASDGVTLTPPTEPTVTPAPTAEPSATPEASADPSAEPTVGPSSAPTDEPTAEPTAEPGSAPTDEPTAEPTAEPGSAPTDEPTAEPTTEPSSTPTAESTAAATSEPTTDPAEASQPSGETQTGTAGP